MCPSYRLWVVGSLEVTFFVVRICEPRVVYLMKVHTVWILQLEIITNHKRNNLRNVIAILNSLNFSSAVAFVKRSNIFVVK